MFSPPSSPKGHDDDDAYPERRELAHRVTGGIEVTLYWERSRRHDRRRGLEPATEELLFFEVARERALDAFYHPFAHLPTRSEELAPGAARLRGWRVTANDDARRRFIDAVIELSDTATPASVLRYLEASAALDGNDAQGRSPVPHDRGHDNA